MDLDAMEQRAREAKARADSATHGRWDTAHVLPVGMCEVASVGTFFIRSSAADDRLAADGFDADQFHARAPQNARFISEARTDVPTLADDVLTLAAEVRRLHNLVSVEKRYRW